MRRCPECGHPNKEGVFTMCGECGAALSVAEDTLDTLVQRASVPNLAALYRKGKEAGLITAGFAGSNPGV